MRMYRHYTQEEILFVKKNIPGRSYIEMTRLFNNQFRLRLTLKQMKTLAYKHRIRNGIGSFHAGQVAFNKGKTHKSQKGTYLPIGSERIDQGYVVVKVSDKKYKGMKNWKRKHTAIWEDANGKVPQGYVVIFADGDNRNFALDNMLLISLKELAVMNKCGLIANHKDLTVVGKTIADLKMAINKRTGKNKRYKQKEEGE